MKEGIKLSAEEFLTNFKRIIETDEDLTLDTKLEDLNDWDSFSLTDFLAFCDEHTSRRIETDELKDAKTVNDLYKVIMSH